MGNTSTMNEQPIIDEYLAFLDQRGFPCIAARAALKHGHIHCLVTGHMACPNDDHRILQFIYQFVDVYRKAKTPYHSVAIIFEEPVIENELLFDRLLWQRLTALRKMDDQNFRYDSRVEADPKSKKFSFSLKEEAFFVIGLHPASPRHSRHFRYPTLVFNPHAEFEKLRAANRYESLKGAVRKRDVAFSGSINPLLRDFGDSSEIFQYSGIHHDTTWKCPLNTDDDKNEYNP